MRNFSRLIFLRRRPTPAYQALDFRPRLDGINQKPLLGVAVAQFALRPGLGHLLVDFATGIRVFEGPFSHRSGV